MPIWSEIAQEIVDTRQPDGSLDFDGVRRRYLAALHEHTGRNVILYASGWLQQDDATGAPLIHDGDIHALMEVTHGLRDTGLDLILHSPGGSPEAAEAIVSYLRARFSHIRVIVPHLAMSAAAMICCAADEILMGKHSFMGPVDPQVILSTPLGVRPAPAQAILDQFARARQDFIGPGASGAWVPMMHQYGPDLLIQCEAAVALSQELVGAWLRQYMFRHVEDAAERAASVADWLSDHATLKSHSRHIPRSALQDQGLIVTDLEEDEELQDLSLSVFHATMHMFRALSFAKIVENHDAGVFLSPDYPEPEQHGDGDE